MKKFVWILLIVLLILLILFLLCREGKLPFCKTSDEKPAPWQTYISNDTNYRHIPADTTEQIIVWRTPGSDDFFSHWLDSIKDATNKNIEITVFCGSCDSNLMLLTGEGIKTFIQGSFGGGKGGGSTCRNPPNQHCSGGEPGGGGDTIYWCVNFPVEFKDSANSDNVIYDNVPIKYRRPAASPIPPPNPGNATSTTTVAVFDTGVDTLSLKNYLYANNTDACLDADADKGWNFADENNIVQDNYNSRVGHGQVVAHLIVDQVNHYGSTTHNTVKILPVKIHNVNGESDLFSVLCGFAYAKDRGAQIINASFGYYSAKDMSSSSVTDPGALLLKAYIKFYLTQNNILLIAAAGNKNFSDDDHSLEVLYNAAGLPIPLGFRNLDSVYFYPASLATDPDLPNVIAVTTVNDTANKTSPNQNYSPTVVDVGVNGNFQLDSDFWFFNPRMAASLVRGSSYATPVVTGIACAFYNDIKADLVDKNKVLDILLSKPSVGNLNTAGGRIRKGTFFDRVH